MAPRSGNVSRPGRMLAVLGVLVLVMLLAIVGSSIASPSSWHKDFRVLLGLDLTSGTTVALQAVPEPGHPLKQSQMQIADQIMLNRVNGAGFTEAQVVQQGSDIINVSVPGGSPQKVVNLVSTTAELLFRQVLLVAPNKASAATPAPSASGSAAPTPSASGSAAPTPSASGSAAPTPSASTKARVIPAPSGTATAATTAYVTSATAAPSATASPAASASASPSPSASASPSASPTPAATSTSGTSTWQQATGDASLVSAQVKKLFDNVNCAAKGGWQQSIKPAYTSQEYNQKGSQVISCGKIGGVWYKYALAKATVLGTMVSSANATPSQTSTTWDVNMNFNSAGTAAFGKLTSAQYSAYHGSPTNPLNQIAIVLDGTVLSAPYTQAAIETGRAQITGNFTENTATTLANQLSYGALPLNFTKQSINNVTPQLGRDQLDAGLLAAAVGLILVLLYLLFYYRGLALIATSSLVIAAVVAYLSVVLLGKYAGLALSLSGIAGLIVAIGITADSFVVYFERLRDEVRDGRSLRAAVERGWTRARRTILVSDTVSFLAAALLYYFAIGDVKGFAFTLGLTTIIDVVVVFTFTKPMITLLARTKFYGGGHPLSGLDPARLGARAPWRGSPRRPASRPRPSSAARASSPRTSPAKEA